MLKSMVRINVSSVKVWSGKKKHASFVVATQTAKVTAIIHKFS